MARAELARLPMAEVSVLKKPTCRPADMSDSLTAVLQKIRAERDIPLFALISEQIDASVCEQVYAWNRSFPEQFDILIHSPGGQLSACYQIARIFCRHTSAWNALVPSYAASGATLICLGSSNIIMSGIAQLGPIDPQVSSRRHEEFFATERQSPLEAFQAIKYLREFALSSLNVSMMFLLDRGMAPRPALDAASSLSSHLAQPILSKIDPYDLGSFALDSALSLNYCQRVGNPSNPKKKTQRTVPYLALVEGYPAHEFIIDIEEARALGFNVSEPSAELDALFDELRPLLDGINSYIGLVPEPKPKVAP